MRILTNVTIYGLNLLPRNAKKRTVQTVRYEKQVPDHHIQVDVKFLHFREPTGQKIRRFQYTAIDDATRVRALRVYNRHTQKNAIDFVNSMIEKFSSAFRPCGQTTGTNARHSFTGMTKI